tara:strand:- start:1515 stop:1748 length:234 start_codon:yes stop_codon:yes gene_type:complete
MIINKEKILNRKGEIEKNKADYLENKNKLKLATIQIEANMQACDGALQDCDYWLSLIEILPEEEKKAVERKLEKVEK